MMAGDRTISQAARTEWKKIEQSVWNRVWRLALERASKFQRTEVVSQDVRAVAPEVFEYFAAVYTKFLEQEINASMRGIGFTVREVEERGHDDGSV